MKSSTCVPGAAAAVACSGCGSGVDRPPGVITVGTGFPPALRAFRDDMHPAWQGVPVRGATSVDLVTAGTYQVAVVCQSGGPGTSFAASVYARTPDDGDTFHAACSNTSSLQTENSVRSIISRSTALSTLPDYDELVLERDNFAFGAGATAPPRPLQPTPR